MIVNISPFAGAGAQFFDSNGVPLAGGLIYTYAAGTTTQQATYTSPTGTIANSNPIVLGSDGRTPQEIWLLNGYSYKFVLQNSSGSQIGSYDNIPSSSSNLAIINDAVSVAYEQGNSTTAGSFVVGNTYLITSIGTTNFQSIGATSNTVGIYFTATGVGSGTGTAQLSRSVQNKLQEFVSVKDFGAKGDGSTNDLTSIQNAINSVATNGGTVYFPPGNYVINAPIEVWANNMSIIGGSGVTITQTSTTLGYPQDGIRVGNPAAVDGGTNNISSPTYYSNIVVQGFNFVGVRIGVPCAYAKNFRISDITCNGAAAVSAGNDTDYQCYNFSISNIHQIGWTTSLGETDFYAVGCFLCNNFTIDGVYSYAGMAVTANASAIEIDNCNYFTASNLQIYQVNAFANGITLTGCTYFDVNNFTASNCKDGLVVFGGGTSNCYGTISSGNLTNCTNAIQVYTTYTTFRDLYTKGSTTSDLNLQTDANYNFFQGCKFNVGGTGVVLETAGSNYASGLDLQKWVECEGIIEGFANGYYGTKMPSFRVTNNGGTTNVTGDGTYYTMVYDTTAYNNGSYINASTGIFTAPITGLYRFDAGLFINNYSGSSWTNIYLYLNISGTYILIGNLNTLANTGIYGGTIINMSRKQTASLVLSVSGGSKHAGTSASSTQNYFTGTLVA